MEGFQWDIIPRPRARCPRSTGANERKLPLARTQVAIRRDVFYSANDDWR